MWSGLCSGQYLKYLSGAGALLNAMGSPSTHGKLSDIPRDVLASSARFIMLILFYQIPNRRLVFRLPGPPRSAKTSSSPSIACRFHRSG